MIPVFRFAPRFWLSLAALVAVGAISYAYGRGNREIVRVSPSLVDTLYMEAKARTDTVRTEVVKWTTRWKVDTAYRADTVTLRDTLRVLVPLAQFDSTIRACSDLASSCERERAAAERVQKALKDSIQTLQPSRFGCVLGYGGTVTFDGRASHGPSLTCGFRVRR